MRRDEALEQLCKLLNLTDDAIAIAEGWSILPAHMQAHFTLLLNDYIAQQHPLLAELYAHASRQDQLRFNRIVEAAQARVRSRRDPPAQEPGHG